MKIELSRTTLRHAALSILVLALFLTTAGCRSGYGTPGGGGGASPSITSLTPASGPVGTSVTIYGSNFGASQGTSTVTFHGTTALPTGWSVTSITAQVPIGATTGNVVVTVGGVPSNGVAFTVTTTTATSSWTYVQDSLATGCTAGASSCTIGPGNMLPTVPGSIWAVAIGTTNNVTISSVTGGGGSWTLCPASSCHIFQSSPIARSLDVAYNLTGNAGTAAVTINLSGSAGSIFGANFFELLPPSGSTASFDTAGTTSATSCTITCQGVGLSLSATDAIIQVIDTNSPASWNGWSSPYTTLPLGEGLYLNATSGAAPTVTVRTPANGGVFTAFAFKSTAGSFTPPMQPISVVNFTSPQGVNCNPTCSLAIPSTGSGHLLYIEAADITSSHITSISGGGTWVIPSGSNTCQITLSSSNALSCGYVLSSTAGVTTLSVTMAGNTNASFAVWEVASTPGSFTFDAQGSATNNPSFNPSGVALSMTGSNDAIFQAIFVPGGTSAVSFYPLPRIPGQGTQFFNAQAAQAALLNASKGVVPVWANEQNNATVVTGIAFSVQ